MATIGDFLNSIATQAGIPADNEDLKTVLSAIGGSTVTVPDSLIGNISKGMMTLDAARNNDKLKDHFFALFANGSEAYIKRTLEEMGADTPTVDAVMNERTVQSKYTKLIERIKESAPKQGKAPKEVEEQIAKLHSDLKAAQEAAQTAVQQERAQWVNKLQTKSMENLLSSFEYGIDLPKEIAIETAKALINRRLADAKYNVGFDPETTSISLLTEGGMTAYENNAPVDFKSFATKVLADNKLLKVAAAAPATHQTPQAPKSGWNPVPPQPTTYGGKPAMDNSRMGAAFEQAVQNL